MVEVTQEDREAAAVCYMDLGPRDPHVHGEIISGELDFSPIVQRQAAHRQAAFNAGRASVLAELESPTEAMLKAGIESDIWNGQPVIRRTVSEVFTAMIGAYKEVL